MDIAPDGVQKSGIVVKYVNSVPQQSGRELGRLRALHAGSPGHR
jgi:hypothetical protein